MLVGLVCAIRSERARREVAAQLGEREEHVRGIIEAAGDAFIAIDGAGRVTEWNAQAGTIFGHRREDAMGAELAALIIPEAQRAAHRNGMTRVLGGGEARLLDRRIEVTAQRADGTEFPAELTLWGTYKSGGRSFNAFVRDVTDRKRQDAEIAAARDAAIEASRLKSEFVANMSHEIRTPMNGVLGMTTLLLDTDLDLVQRDYAETAANSAEALLTVVNDILDFSKIEAGKLDIEDTDFLLRPLAEEVAALLAPAAQAKGLEVTALVDPDVPAAVRGDPHRLRQVVTNLLGNAVKFTEHGEVAFRVSTVEGGGIRLTVRDTGIGISPEHGRRLFEAFSQADASTTRRYGGTGLGLTISRQLVELMGGTLDFTSTEGAGTTFWADLPLPAVAAPAVSAPVRRCPTDARVLVVDDNATNRKVLEQFLGSWSLEPHCVADGRTALEDLRSAAEAGTPFDAVILDMHMPGMSGVDVAKAVLADPDLAGTPLAVLTSTNDQGEAAGARKAGVGVYLTKPVREAQLYEGLSRLLGGRTTSPTPSTAAAPRPRPDTRLLVAEDNTVNQQVLVAMLGVLGYDADVAVDGRHALELFAVGDYAAVLMDCQMPRLDGYAATRELRALGGRGAAVPVIALTASARADDEQRCREAGMDDFVTKPLRPETLACILDRWVGADGVAAARPVPAGAADPTGPLDRETLDELAALGPDLVRGVVTAFLATVPDRLTELRAAVARQDVAAVRGLVHGVRGSAGHVGATALVEVLARLEDDDGAEAVEHLAAVEAELARVTTALHDVLAG
jgi:PAS domain S-box-containing protein